jgi:hypothetical protein
MKNLSLIFVFFVPIICFGQVNESFLDGNFSNNPIWTGTTSNFIVNSAHQLQSKATTTSTSFLFTPSEAFENASWECWVKITYTTSSSNYAEFYLASDKNDITDGCNGYYVQVGGTNDEVSLFVQEGTKKTKIIDGTDKRTDGNPVELRIKVTRDADGKFTLFSKLVSESDYVLEGTTVNNLVKSSSYVGLLFANTSNTGSDYYFDDIFVSGNKAVDKEAPIWTGFMLEQPNKLKLDFSEAMDFSHASFNVNPLLGIPSSQIVSTDKSSIELIFLKDFERGKIYTLQISGLTDLAGNMPAETSKSIGIIEPKATGDLILNEVMFENPLNSLEYIEIYNKTEKILDVSGLVFTTRKTDGSLNTGNNIPPKTLLLPHSYLALCEDADSVRNYHKCPLESNILTTTWSTLNNESATLVLANEAKDTIYDELTYNVKWHNSWVKEPKGIALERTGPDMPTQSRWSWHSASSEGNYGTPGYKNSEYIDLEAPGWTSFSMEQPNKLNLAFSEPMDFGKATFIVDSELGHPTLQIISEDKTKITLGFRTDFQKGKIYTLQVSGLTDLAGNMLTETKRSIGIIEPTELGDLVFNEVMFDNPINSTEYIEIYNTSEKVLNLSGLIFTTRKTDGTLNTGNAVPKGTLIMPKGYLALCEDADSVRNYHNCPAESNIVSTSWSGLNNESATLVLTNATKDSIYDELAYNVKWHHPLVKNPKGVALERINPLLPTQDPNSWHSAASEVNYGTPGYKNSQYRDIDDKGIVDKTVWTEPEAFSPDNDGVDDVCFIHYKTDANGYVANVLILNAVGVKVFQLATNILLSTEGFLIWDGKTDTGKNANVGIYVLYFEMFNPQTGARKQLKKPIVVSSR